MSDFRRPSRAIALLLVAIGLGPLACRLGADREIAERILERHRRVAGGKPLPGSYVVRIRLSPEAAGGGTGLAEIAWEPNRYRERISSAGVTTERGIQSGKAYFTDEDGVTRVASEPILRELLARSYFWRRAWLFADRGGARPALGPADEASQSVRLQPSGSNPLFLSFSRRTGQLLGVRSPRFVLDFRGPRSFREVSGRAAPVRGDVVWLGLPTGALPDAAVGGECGRFAPGAPPVEFERTDDGGISVPARVNGTPLRLAIDSTVDAPLALSPEKADALGLSFPPDVYGRRIASGATVEVAGFQCRGAHVQRIATAPAGADGVVGGTIMREAVLELDPASARLALHDPAAWVAPAGFHRMIVDDDGNRPVATLRKGSGGARLTVASATGSSDLRIAPTAAERLEIGVPGLISGFRWGALALPALRAEPESSPTDPEWGDDGRLGFPLLLRFHVYLDMPHRWIYLQEPAAPR